MSDFAVMPPGAARPARRTLAWPRRRRGAWPRLGLAWLAAQLQAEWQRLPLWLPVAMGAGILGYFALPWEPGPSAWVSGLALGALLAAGVLARRHALSAWALALAGMAGLGFATVSWHAAQLPPPLLLPGGALVLEGRVTAVQPLPEGLRVTLGAPRTGPEQPPLPRSLRIRLRDGDPARPRPGQSLRIRALVRAPAAPAYPGAWDFQRTAFFAGLGGSGFALGPVEILEEASADPPRLALLRGMIEARVAAALPGAEGAIAAALLTGGQSAIPPDALRAMRDSGLAHLLSVSGLHIAIVMGLGYGLLRVLLALLPCIALRWDSKRLAAPGALLLGGLYLLLTGAEVPMQRSFAMAALVTLGVLVGRRAWSLRALGLAAVAVLLLQPAALLGASFQMSFAAVLALIAGAEAAAPLLARWRAQGPCWWRKPALVLGGLLASSILAGLATTPYGLHHFGRLQLYGVAANLLAVPVTSFWVMPCGMLALALMPLGLEAWPLALMGGGVQAILAIAETVAAWPGVALVAEPIPGWGLALASFGLLWLCLWQRRWRLLGLPLLALGLGSAALVTPPDLLVSADARLIALRLPDGSAALQQAAGASAMTREGMLRRWGLTEASRPACTEGVCRFQPQPDGPVALLLSPPAAKRGQPAPLVLAAAHCGQAALLVSAEPIRGRCPEARVLDRFSVWRDGPHAVWLGPDGVTVLSDRAARGARPWVPPPPPRLSSGAAARPDAPVP